MKASRQNTVDSRGKPPCSPKSGQTQGSVPTRLLNFCAIALLFCFLLGAFVVWLYFGDSGEPDWRLASPDSRVEVEIPAGASAREIAKILKSAGVVRSAKMFEIFVRINGKDRNIKSGLYEFSLPIRQSELLKKLVKGDVKLIKITIPEGLTIREIDALLSERKIANSGEFERAARSSPIAKRYGADTLEGFLFPDTYLVRYDVTVEELIGIMTKRFDEVFEAISGIGVRGSGLATGDSGSSEIPAPNAESRAVLDVVILASLIEKETAVEEERALVSAVFHNRLKKGMKLQSDPSVIYGLKEFDGNLTKEHLRNPHPYNTYVHLGLPKGPICNPGKSSLVAALNPSDVDYLYFVSKGDGTHFFSSNYAEHTKAVLKYQMNR